MKGGNLANYRLKDGPCGPSYFCLTGGILRGGAGSGIRPPPSAILRSFGNEHVAFGFGGDGDGDGGGGDSFTDVYYEPSGTVGERVGDSLAGLFVGPIFLLLGCWLLWKNEGWAVRAELSLGEARKALKAVADSRTVDSQHDGNLVHVSGRCSVPESSMAVDPDFGVKRANAISIHRMVEIYQWVETSRKKKRKLRNGQTEVRTTYHYNKKWVPKPIQSSNFRIVQGHENIGEKKVSDAVFTADQVNLGNYILSEAFIRQLKENTFVPAREVQYLNGGVIRGNKIYFSSSNKDSKANNLLPATKEVRPIIVSVNGEDKIMYEIPSGDQFALKADAMNAVAEMSVGKIKYNDEVTIDHTDQVGDVRVAFSEVKCKTVSVLGKLEGGTIRAWRSKQGRGYDISPLVTGRRTGEEMLEEAEATNRLLTYAKRAGGWVLNFIGFSMITSIISTTAKITLNWIPLLGPMTTSIIGLGVSIANFTLASALSLLIASIAWSFYRPLKGTSMLLASFGIFYLASKVRTDPVHKKN